MTKTPQQQLDELASKVTSLVAALTSARNENQRLNLRLERVESEYQHLNQKLTVAQQQIDQMLDQWFPELELSNGKEHANN